MSDARDERNVRSPTLALRVLRGELFVLLLCSLCLSACWLPGHPIGTPFRSKTRFEAEWKHYLMFPETKCLAGVGDRNGVYVSGFATSPVTRDLEIVKDIAVQRCEKRRKERKLKGPCEPWAIGPAPTAHLKLGSDSEDRN